MADDQIRIIVGEIKELSEKVVVKLTLDITANLIESTPVDTGWARANWVPRIGEPYTGGGIVFDSKEDQQSSVGSARGDQQSGTASLLTYDLARGPVFVSNNVPYIQVLNSGSSKQAPSAFVEAGIQQAINANRNIRL